MPGRQYIAVLFALALLGVALPAGGVDALEKYYFPIKAIWWCHAKSDVVRVMDTPDKTMPSTLMRLIVKGRCAHGAFGFRWGFLPSNGGEKTRALDGTQYILVGGRIFPDDEAVSVWVAAKPDSIRPYASTPGRGI